MPPTTTSWNYFRPQQWIVGWRFPPPASILSAHRRFHQKVRSLHLVMRSLCMRLIALGSAEQLSILLSRYAPRAMKARLIASGAHFPKAISLTDRLHEPPRAISISVYTHPLFSPARNWVAVDYSKHIHHIAFTRMWTALAYSEPSLLLSLSSFLSPFCLPLWKQQLPWKMERESGGCLLPNWNAFSTNAADIREAATGLLAFPLLLSRQNEKFVCGS